MPPESGDPLDWAVDQVVEFLCHNPKTPWSQSTAAPPRPDPATFEDALRSNMITGEVLLYDVDKATLREDLGLKKIGHWSTILMAIRYLQNISQKYQRAKAQRSTPFEHSPSVFFPETPKVFSEAPRVIPNDGVNGGSTRSPKRSTSPPPEKSVEDSSASSPRLRPQEHYVVDQQGRKRRKLDLGSITQAPVNGSASPKSNDIHQARDNTNDALQAQDKKWYIGPNKIAPYELFYPLTLDDDAEDTFVMCSPNFPTAQRLFVKKRLHHFYRQEPLDLGSDDGSSKLAVMPYKHSITEDRRQKYFTLYSSRGGKVTIQQESIEKWPQLYQRESPHSENSTGALKSSDPFSYLIQKYPVQKGDDGAYPLYGDSGSEGEYDEETWQEIEHEQQEPMQWKQERLSSTEIDSIIAKCINDFENKWSKDHQPKEERKARKLWLTARKNKSTNQQIKTISRDLSLLDNRLRKIQAAIRGSEYTTVSELQMQCQSMEQTVFNIQAQKWRVSVLERPDCPPKVLAAPKPPPAPKPKPNTDGEESLHSESDVESDGSLDDFIIDDLGTDSIIEEQILPDSSSKKAQEMQEAQKTFLQVSSSPSSDSDAVISPSGIRRKFRKKRAAFQGKERTPDSSVIPLSGGSPVRRDASPSPSNVTGAFEYIDLTMDSPPPEVDDDLRIETPPLNPSVPKVLHQTEKKVKTERHISISPQPGLGPSVFVEIRNKKHMKDDKARDKKSTSIDFGAITRTPWDVLEERRDRRRLLAKLVRSLPDKERKCLAKKIPDFLSPLLWKYVIKALKAMANRHHEIRGVDESDQELARRTASLYISWVNCKHYADEGMPKRDLTKAREDSQGFMPFQKELSRCLVEHDKWLQSQSATESEEVPSEDDDLRPSSSTPHKKRKREVKESQEVKRNHESAQLRVAVQDEQRRRLERKMESMGLSNSDPTRQAVSFGSPIIYLHPHIGRRVKQHQLNGIQFMWRELIEDEKRQGCVLAHTMGLGKTMQVISLLVTISAAAGSSDANVSQQVPPCFHRSQTLVMCPSSLIENWYEEFLMWTPKKNGLGPIRKITSSSALSDRLQELFAWDEEGGILIMSYDIFRTWILNKETKARGKPLGGDEHARIKQCLLDGPNIIVADEAHKMKNRASGIATAASEFRSKSRIALTGSPLANNLSDYYSMVDWISPGYLGNSVEFKANYVEPIEEGLYADSSYRERRRSLVKLQVLKEILNPKVNRADISVLAGSLPPKVEFVITVSLTDLQKKAYNSYVESIFQGRGDVGNAQLWSWIAILSLCCNHPACFRDKLLSRVNDAAKLSKKSDDFDNNADVVPGDESIIQAGLPEAVVANQQELFSAISDMKALNLSYRAQILNRIITESIKAGDKVLVFSHSLPTLDYIEHVLKTSRHNYCRLDGQTPIFSRQAATKRFNSTGSEQVYLISTRAGGLGLNIPGANRVVIFDFSFSPVWEEQAVGRAYRLGQQKPVFVYRFIAGGTFEEIMYNKAIFKTQLAFRVVDKKNPIRWASKSLGDYLFPVKEVKKENVSEYIGKDANVLDKIIREDKEGIIRKIALTETFQREDNDKLTEEEKQGVQMEIKDEQLKRTDPVAYEKLMKERQQQEAIRMGATMSNAGSTYHYGYQMPQFRGQYNPSSGYMPSVTQQYPYQTPPQVPSSAHNSGPPPLAPDTSVFQPPTTAAPLIFPGVPERNNNDNNLRKIQSETTALPPPSVPTQPNPSAEKTAPPAPPAPLPSVDGPSDETSRKEMPVEKPQSKNTDRLSESARDPPSVKSPCNQQ